MLSPFVCYLTLQRVCNHTFEHKPLPSKHTLFLLLLCLWTTLRNEMNCTSVAVVVTLCTGQSKQLYIRRQSRGNWFLLCLCSEVCSPCLKEFRMTCCAALKNVVQLVELHVEHTHCGLSTAAVSDKQKEIIIIQHTAIEDLWQLVYWSQHFSFNRL